MIGYVYKKSDYIIVGKISGVIQVYEDRIENENKDVIRNISGKFDYFVTDNDTFNVGDIFDINLKLEDLRQVKLKELDEKCTATIEAGFQSSALDPNGIEKHLYRFDLDKDQHNFEQQVLILLLNPTITQVTWKTEDAGYLPHTKGQFLQVVNDIAVGKKMVIDRYWDLKQDVLDATTEEGINNINW